MSASRNMLLVSLITILLGVAWLLNVTHVLPGVDWVWTLTLGGGGVVVLGLGRFGRGAFVLGSFLIASSIASLLRQTGRINPDVEIPALVIVLGLLMLIATVAPWWGKQSS